VISRQEVRDVDAASAGPPGGPGAAYDDGVLRILAVADGLPGVVLAGEIDEQNRAGLAAALDKLAAGHQQFYVDMAAVSYCDLAGLRAILRLGGDENREWPGQVVLHRLPGYLDKIIRIVGWDSYPGVSIRGVGRPAGEPPPLA
jgi:ABC-type transporter Mla MlaB component